MVLQLLGADKLSKLESSLAAVKLFAIVAFIVMSLLLVTGIIPGSTRLGSGELASEPFMPGGIKSIAGMLSENVSPMVAALNRWGVTWAGTVINLVLITAILSTMLAAMFGLGRMIRYLAVEKHDPKWLKDEKDVPYRGILFSGLAMLAGLGFGFLLPRIYLFLISSGGFAVLFTYAAIMATHIRFR